MALGFCADCHAIHGTGADAACSQRLYREKREIERRIEAARGSPPRHDTDAVARRVEEVAGLVDDIAGLLVRHGARITALEEVVMSQAHEIERLHRRRSLR